MPIKLKDIIDMTRSFHLSIFANGSGRVLFKGEQFTPEYEEVKKKYGNYIVTAIIAGFPEGGHLRIDVAME